MAKFCPECGKATIKIELDKKMRDACPDGHFVAWPDMAFGIGALVIKDDKALFIERGTAPVGLWTLPSGWLEPEELLPDAVIREVYEETKLTVDPIGVLVASNRVHRGRNEMYIVFICKADSQQEISVDREEILQAKFINPDDFDSYQIAPFDQYIVREYLAQNLRTMSLSNYQLENFYAWESKSEE